MKKEVLESMTKIALPKYTIRVWRSQKLEFEYAPGAYSDIEQMARANEDDSPTTLAKKIGALPGVEAVEVLGWDAGGVVYYPDWK